MNKIIRKVINTSKAPKAIGPYSQAVQVNHVLHVSGQIGLNPETMEFVGVDVASQTKQVLLNLGSILDAAGSSYKNGPLVFDQAECIFMGVTNTSPHVYFVVETTILLADMNDYKTVNDVYATFFTAPYPARAAFQCAALPKAARVEIKAVAIVGDVEDQ